MGGTEAEKRLTNIVGGLRQLTDNLTRTDGLHLDNLLVNILKLVMTSRNTSPETALPPASPIQHLQLHGKYSLGDVGNNLRRELLSNTRIQETPRLKAIADRIINILDKKEDQPVLYKNPWHQEMSHVAMDIFKAAAYGASWMGYPEGKYPKEKIRILLTKAHSALSKVPDQPDEHEYGMQRQALSQLYGALTRLLERWEDKLGEDKAIVERLLSELKYLMDEKYRND
jgi:hypothetical protein